MPLFKIPVQKLQHGLNEQVRSLPLKTPSLKMSAASALPGLLRGLFNRITAEGEEDNGPLSYLGKATYSPLQIAAGKYKTADGTEVSYEELFVAAHVIEVEGRKEVAVNPILGGKHAAVITSGPNYSLIIRGVMATEKGVNYPDEEVKRLIEILKSPEAIAVTSVYLQHLGISRVLITSFTLWQEEGFRNSQYFEINAIDTL